MYKCKECKNGVKKGFLTQCCGCGRTYCEKCAQSTKKICPKCYHTIEIIG